jgi:ABC-type amino acid transport substrate-binding protein
MPYTDVKDDKLVGLDGDIVNEIAAKLHLRVEPDLLDFNGMLGGVQSRRVDMAVGSVGWTEDRQKQGLFSDPPYYSPPTMGVRAGKTYATVADLEGQKLGTVSGYIWVKALQQVPGSQVHLYPDANGVFADLGAQRLDAGFLDPLLIPYYAKKRPDAGIQTEYLEPPSAAEIKAHPEYSVFEPYMTGYYIPQQETKLEQAVSKQIRAMYANGDMAKLITKWGGDPQQFLKPSAGMAEQRRGVDRSADWTPPSM